LCEKPDEFVSDLAIIGIYYVRNGEMLAEEINYLLEHNLKEKGEFQLTNALEAMKSKGFKFYPGKVDEWLDCGNKDATVYTNQRILELNKSNPGLISKKAVIEDSKIIAPCFIGDNVTIKCSVIGPHVSIGAGSNIDSSIVRNSMIQDNTTVKSKIIDNSMIGSFVNINGSAESLSIGDYSTSDD